MGHYVHITRQSNWHDENPDLAISLSEWTEYAARDPEILIVGYDESMQRESEGLAVWTGWSEHDPEMDSQAWIDFSFGNLEMKNPNREMRVKMFQIAMALSARVQGVEGEFYGPDGEEIESPQGEQPQSEDTSSKSKTWWKFW